MTILLESAIRVTLIAAVIAMVLFAMRIKTASVQHAVWAGVVVLMLLLPAWVAWGPKAPLPVLPSDRTPVVVLLPPPSPVELVSRTPSSPVSVPVRGPAREGGGYVAIYLLGVGVLLLRLGIGTLRANRLTSASCVVPVTVGLLHPRIILPKSSHGWPQAQLDAVLAHEGEHIRRRDPLFQWLALLNRALFWFHPLAWWLERQLSGLAEEACDAAVIARGYDPREYSEYLLELARSVQQAGARIDAVGMAMPGIGLKHRIRQMLSGVPVAQVSRLRLVCAAAVCAILSAILAAGTLVQAQSSPTFEVASVKIHKGGGGTTRELKPGSIRYLNITLGEFIYMAYGVKRYQLAGPDWAVNNASSDRYDIVAKAAGNVSTDQVRRMIGPLLAERFQLEFHREVRDLPVYALTVLKGGPKFKEGDGGEYSVYPDGTGAISFKNYSMDAFAYLLSNMPAVGRAVLDRTGLKGKYTFTANLTDSPAGTSIPDVKKNLGADADPVTSPIPSNLQIQLGLKLDAIKAPIEMIVIDHIEKTPTEN